MNSDPPPDADIVCIDPEQASRLLRLLRELQQFLEACDDDIVADAIDDHFGFQRACDSYAAVIELEADRLKEAIDTYNYPYEAHAN